MTKKRTLVGIFKDVGLNSTRRGGVYMAENQIQPGLAGQSKFPQIRSFWKDVTEFYMFILQRAFSLDCIGSQ